MNHALHWRSRWGEGLDAVRKMLKMARVLEGRFSLRWEKLPRFSYILVSSLLPQISSSVP